VDGGYQLHDYLHYQPSRTTVLAEREEKTQAGLKGNHKRWHVERRKHDPTCPLCIAEGIAPAIAPATSVGVPPSRPDPSTNYLHYSRVQGLAAVKADQKCVDCFGKGWVIPVDSDTARRCDCVTEAAS
jgi:hypothetical protein